MHLCTCCFRSSIIFFFYKYYNTYCLSIILQRLKTESFSSEWFQRNMARTRSEWCSPRSDRSKSAEFSGDQMVRAEVGVLSAQALCSWPHSRYLLHSRVNILIKYLFSPLHPWNEVLFTPSSTHSIPIVLSCHHPSSQPPHLTVKGHHTRCPAQWPVALATTGCWCSWAQLASSTQLLLYHLLYHTLQRLELACRYIPYVALYCIKLQITGSTSLWCWCIWLSLSAETLGYEFLLSFSPK